MLLLRRYYRTSSALLRLASSSSSSSSPLSPPPPFDTSRFVHRLEAGGWSRAQAEAVLATVAEVLHHNVEVMQRTNVTKAEHEKNVYVQKSDFQELRNEIQMMENNNYATLKTETERLAMELDKIKFQMKDELNKLQGGIRLDLNLERGRLRDLGQDQEAKITETSSKIDSQVADVRTQIETLKFDLIKYIAGSVVSIAALFLGYIRLMK